jgi:hypothetical protein
MNKIKLIGLMAVCDEHIIYQSLNALLIWDFLKLFFNENIKVITYLYKYKNTRVNFISTVLLVIYNTSRFSMFALHFGILLRLFCKCGSFILILLDKCMLWWFHVRINTNYVRYQHIAKRIHYLQTAINPNILKANKTPFY